MLSHFSRVWLWPYRPSPHQAPLFMQFSREEYWSRLPCPLPGDLPDPGIEPVSLTSPALAGRFFTMSTTRTHRQMGKWGMQLDRKLGTEASHRFYRSIEWLRALSQIGKPLPFCFLYWPRGAILLGHRVLRHVLLGLRGPVLENGPYDRIYRSPVCLHVWTGNSLGQRWCMVTTSS